jgi:trehalose 6-phosphate synthase
MMNDRRLPSRLVVVSNRGPYHLRVTKQGMRREKSIGGLVTSVLPMLERIGGTWIAWGEPEGRFAIPPQEPRFTLRNLSLTPEQVKGYYLGLSNSGLWPLCHYFLGRARYDLADWRTYEQVNQLFAQTALDESDENDVIWLHDYQLARAAHYIRQQRPSQPVLLFWHIPFPAVEVFRTFPWRRAVMEGMLACDLVGFHIQEYAHNFIETAVDLLGAQAEGETIRYGGRLVEVMARPIGIDFEAVDRDVRSSRTQTQATVLRQSVGDQSIVLGVERMDYTKGIAERIRGVERLLENQPSLTGRFCLIQIVTPSRTEVEAYQLKKREIDEAVGRVNGRFSDGVWSPVRYLYRAVSFTELLAYYRAADISLVTPLRDGLNLVAKEYVASRINCDGVLILSEFAGAARQLPEALLTNPYSSEDMANALERALRMSAEEQQRRMAPMRRRVAAQDIRWWAREFLTRIGFSGI